MLHAAEEVEGEGEAKGELETALDGKGQAAESGGDAGALDMQANQGSGDVRGHVGVQGAGEGAAGDTGPGGCAEPGLLYLVDAQVGGDGTVQALVDEDLLALLEAELVGGGGGSRESTNRASQRARSERQRTHWRRRGRAIGLTGWESSTCQLPERPWAGSGRRKAWPRLNRESQVSEVIRYDGGMRIGHCAPRRRAATPTR